MTMEEFPLSAKFASELVSSLLPGAQVLRAGSEGFHVSNAGKSVVVSLGRDVLEDLEVALVGGQPVRYTNGLKNSVRFRFLTALGSFDMIPDVRMSEAVMGDERDWLARCRIDLQLSPEMTARLYDGLRTLKGYLSQVISLHGEIAELRRDLSVVESMTSYFEERGNLDSRGVQIESLSYLKAAAVCSIRELESKKDSTASARVKRSYDEKIYSIVQFLQNEPYSQIKLPETLFEYVNDVSGSGSLPRSHVSSSEQSTADQLQLDGLLSRINPRFTERRRGAWQAFKSQNPDGLSQAASSMVELLDQVIRSVCNGIEFKEFLRVRLNSKEQSDWVVSTRHWISQTKSNLHTVKHHTEPQSPLVTEQLLRQAESIMRLILE